MCFPKVFYTDAFLMDPQNNYVDNTIVFFDAVAKRQRVDIEITNPNPLKTTVLLRYDKGIGYQFDEGGANCFDFQLFTDLSQFCFSPTTQRLSDRRIGSRYLTELLEPLADGKVSQFTVSGQGLSSRPSTSSRKTGLPWSISGVLELFHSRVARFLYLRGPPWVSGRKASKAKVATTSSPHGGAFGAYSVVARDAAGNRTRAESAGLFAIQ